MPTQQTELTTEQTELIKKLNCLEFETSQLNRAYQLWRSHVEHGKPPDWMTAAIRITYDDLIRFGLDTALTIPVDVPHAVSAKLAQLEAAAGEISGILEKESTAAEPSPELLPITEPEPDWFASEMPIAIFPPSTSDSISQQPAIQGQQEEERLSQLWAKALVYDTAAEPSPELLPMMEPEPEPDWSAPGMPVAIFPPSTRDAISEQPAIQQSQEKCNCRECATAQETEQEEEAGSEISGILGEESTTVEQSPELLRITEPEPDWSGPGMPVATSLPSIRDAISEQPAIQQGPQEDEAGAEPVAIHIPATLANWLQGASTGRLFRAASVAIVMVAGLAIGIYLGSPRRAAPGPVQNSAAQAAAGALAIPTGEKAEFKFDPDPAVARLGSSFLLNAVLSRGSDIASVAAQIDYDANLLQFMGVSEGKFLVKDGQQVVLTQRDDPLTGILRISAEESPGNPGISGDGPVFALSFQARKRGKATVSIVPGARDSQGRRIEMAGSQVSVKVN